jgi:autotransporter translocation and assembly factor TamB
VQIEGQIDAAIFALLSDGLAARGETKFQAAIGGPFGQPEISGNLTWQDGELSLDSPSMQLEDLNVRLGFTPERVSIEQFNGNLNGGAFKVTGGFGYSGFNMFRTPPSPSPPKMSFSTIRKG